jgi:hypothetical protein
MKKVSPLFLTLVTTPDAMHPGDDHIGVLPESDVRDADSMFTGIKSGVWDAPSEGLYVISYLLGGISTPFTRYMVWPQSATVSFPSKEIAVKRPRSGGPSDRLISAGGGKRREDWLRKCSSHN